ncbi:MAG: Ig-like domain-containing protein [Cyclobacteriaceae bacterium]
MIRSSNNLRQTLFVLFTILTLGLFAQSTFTVTNINDSGTGSLRQAITDANDNGEGLDIINFSEDVSGTILLNSQLPVITTALTINGPGEEVLSVSGQNAYRILFINSTGDVTISDLTLTEGRAHGGNAGSGASGGGGGAGMGGAIFHENGQLELNFVSLTGNSANGGNGGVYNNPSTAFGGAGGAGPLGAGGSSPTGDGVNGMFGSGGSGGGLRFSGEPRANGGNGGYGAGGGSVGSSGGGASGVGTTGVPGTFGGSTSNPANGIVQAGGGGAGLGAALFIYGGSVSLNTVKVLNNSTQAGGPGGSGATSGQAKASGIFHYSGTLTNSGVFISGNSASNAGSSDSDNADFYSETGFSLAETNAPVISKSIPADGENNYQKEDGLTIFMNENIYNTDGSAVVDADLSGIITFKETNASGSDVPFTAALDLNKLIITPDEELANGQTYYMAVANLEDRYGNEMATPETLTFTVDGAAPVFTADPASGTTILGRSFAFTADEAFFDLDGTGIEPSEYINVVKVRLDDAIGELVSTTITREGNTLQVSLDESLPDQLYHVTLESIADANGNEIAPQVFTYSRPSFAEAKIRVNPRDGSTLSTRAIEVTFEEDYYVETAPGTFALFNTRSYSQSYTDAVLDLKLNDENGTDIIDRWSFDDGKLYILNDLAPSSTYYFQIANLFTADQTPVESVEMTFTTPDTFNPVQGSGYAVSFGSVYTDQNESLGTAYSAEFAVKMNSSGYNQVFFWGWSPTNADKMIFWLNGDKLTLSKVDGSANIIDNQTIESSAITGFESYQEVAFTYDNGNIVLYHNGVAVGSGSMDLDNYKLTGFAYPSSSTITGSFGTVYLSGRGLLYTDEIRIWNTALTAQTILDGINTPITTAHPQFADLKHLWTFDENGGKLGFDAKTGIANLCFSCSGATPNWEKSNRRDEPLIQVSHGGETLVVGDEISFIAGNGGQLQKEFTITNTGTADLELLGEASVSDFEGRFTIDYSETETTLASGASTSFTITFQSNDVRTYNTIITIPNNSLDNSFELSLTAKGISATSGNWQTFGAPGELPQIFDMWAHDGKLTVTAELTQEPYTRFIVDVTENASGGLSYSTPTYLSSSVGYGSHYIDLMGDESGNYYVQNSNNIGEIKNLITNDIQTYGVNTTHDDLTDGEVKTDRNGVIHYLHSFYDGAATNSFGLKIEKGHPSTETITLTFEDLVNFGGTINNATHITAYSMGFDSNNDLYVALLTNESNPEPRLYVLKYDASTGWDDLGYDSFTDPYRSTLSVASYLKLVIDENDFLHLGTVSDQALIYQKLASDGTLIEGGSISDGTLGLNIAYIGSFSRNNFFGLGAAGEPMFIVKSGSNSVSSVVYEDGELSLFNEQYITGSDPGSFSSFFCSIDQQTGQPYVLKNGIGNNVAYTMQGISPELSVTFDGDPLERGANWPIQTGVGTSYEFDMIVSNSGFTNLHLTGDPLLAITGDQSADLSYNADELPSILKIGESVTIPITFAPTTIYTNSELMVQLSTNSPYGDFEFTISLSSLDDTNTGEWTLHTDIVDPPYTDVDMRIGKNGQPVYTYNTYQTIVYQSGPNAGVTIPYARLETYQGYSGTNTFDPDILNENINLTTAYPPTDYFPQIQSLVNPTNNLNYFAFGRISSGIVPTLYTVNPVAGLSVADYAYSLAGRADFEFDEDGTSWFLGVGDVSPGYVHIAAAQAGEQNITFSGTSRNSKDLDLEITPDFMYSMTQEHGQSLGYKSPRGTHSTDQGSVVFLGSSSNQLRNGNYSNETHNKDIEIFNSNQYTAWIRSDGGIEFYENTAFISNPGVSNVIDLQLQIHPDGTPYIAYIEDLGNNQFPVSVVKYVDGNWETVGEPRFSYGDYDDQHTGLTNAPTRPALRAAFQINDLGQLFVFYGDIYTVTEAPEAFNHPPAFTSTPGTEANEGEEYLYEIAASDSDLDALTIGTVDLPEWLTFSDNGDGTALLSGTPTDENAIAYSFSVTVSDGSLITSQEIALTVNDLNTQPYFDQPVSTITIDQDVELQILDLTGLSDGDFHQEQSLSFEVVSDNEFLLSSLSAIANEDGTGSLLYQPASGESGVANITLTLLDDGTPQESISYDIEITVNPVTDPNAIVVTNTNDSGDGSLRAAITAANENPDHNVIDMRFIEGTIALANTLPALTTNMDIVGTDASPVTVSGENAHQVFYMTSGNVLLKGFKVANGLNRGGDGTQGSGGGGGGAGFGGAVFLDGGNLIVDRMNFSDNVALGGNGGDAGAVNGGTGGASIFGTGGAGGAAGNFDTHGAAGESGAFYGTGGGGGEKGFSGFSGGKGGDGNFGGGAGGGAGVSSGSSYGNPGNAGTFGGNAGKANNGGAGGGGAGLGGAIYAKSGNLIVNATAFASNAATGGSKGTNSGSTSVIQPTNGSGKGGAIFLYQDVAYKLTDVVYSGNSATSHLNTIGDDNNIYIGTDQGAPSIFLSNTSIDENQSGPVLIGNLSTFTGNPSDVFYYTIISSSLDENDLEIDGDELNYMGSGLDFETLASFDIQVESTAGSATNLSNFTISVNDLDDPATDFDLNATSLDEGQDTGTVVGSFSVTDEDGGDNTLILSSDFGDNAFFQIDGDELQTAAVLDFDEQSSYFIQVELNDLVKQFTITVNNINVAPSAIELSGASTPENGFADVLIGTLSTIDTDDEDTHTYTIVGGTTSLENEDVKLVGNELYTNRSFDFETEPEITVEIRSTDNGLESLTQTLTITIEDANDVPTGIELSVNTVEENVEVGTVIATVSVLDPDINDQHTLTLTQGYEQNYAVSIDGLNIVSAIPLDYEILSSLALQLLVEDAASGLNQFEIVIDVVDLNEAPTDIFATNTSFDENAQYGTVIGALSAVDQDADNTHTYKVLTYTEEDGVKTYDVLAQDGNVIVANTIDFETTPSLTIDIEVLDQGGLSFVKTFEFTINDVNERPGEPSLSNQAIEENSPTGSVVGQISSEDPDTGDILTYTLNSEYGGGSLFEIVGDELKTADELDYETWNDPEILITVTDDGGQSYEKYFTILINDINEAPTAITLSKSDIDEDAEPGSIIGTLSTSDQDLDDTHTYEVLTPHVVDGQTFFPIVADGSNLITTVFLDYETIPVFEIEVKSTDAEGLSFTETFILTANDKNDVPTGLELSSTEVSENTAIGTVVGTLSTSDQDAGDTHTYDLETGFGDNAAFSISGNELLTNEAIDFEAKVSYEIKIRTADGRGGIFYREFTIGVLDVNEAPTAITLSANTIDENAAVGTLIGSLTADDQDADAAHTFSLVSGFGDNASFEISGNELQNAAVFDFETKSNYTVKIKADDGAGGVFEQEFGITVNNVSEGSPQTITFGSLEAKTFGDAPFELTATASSELEVIYTSSDEARLSISGSTATILGAGQVTITASQPGTEGTFEAADPVSQVLTINKASQTISFDALADQISGADPITLSATSTSGLEVSFSATGAAFVDGNTLTLEGTGEVVVTASQSGNANFEAASDVVQSFVVNDPAKTDQTITFDPPATVYVTDESIELSATSDSGLEVSYEIVSGDEFATLSVDVLNIEKAGTINVRAYQAGNATFNPASVVKTIVIKPVFKVSGKVTNETGGAFTAGTVALLSPGKTNGVGAQLDASGNYQFSDIKDGVYYVGVIPDDESAYYATAYGNVIIYQNATTINVTSDVSGIDIQMVARDSGNELTGDGEVTGRVIEDDGTGSRITMGRILEGTPIEGASIFLVRKSDDKILTEVFSDANGDFTISGIPEGSFSILINIPGVEGTVSSDITVKEGTQVLMTAMVGEDGIVFESEVTEALSLRDIQTSLKVYPNPAVEMISVSFEGSVSRLDWRLISLYGQEIKSGTMEGVNETTINVSELSNGVYFLVLQDGMGLTKQIKVIK